MVAAGGREARERSRRYVLSRPAFPPFLENLPCRTSDSSRDMFQWDRALRGGKLLSKESHEQLYTVGLQDYALGSDPGTSGSCSGTRCAAPGRQPARAEPWKESVMVRTWREVRSFGVALLAAAVVMCAAAPAQAQRPTASFEWQKHEAAVTYGV